LILMAQIGMITANFEREGKHVIKFNRIIHFT